MKKCMTIMLICSIGQLSAVTYYVDPNGSDSNSGQSINAPWSSISKVNNTNYNPGDSILFKRGASWSDGIETTSSGSAGAPYSITENILDTHMTLNLNHPTAHNCVYYGAYGSGNKPKIDMGGSGKAFEILHDYIFIENLHFHDGGNGILALDRQNGNFWVTVKDCDLTQVDGNVVRIYNGGGNLWFDGLYIYDYRINGIYISGSSSNQLEQVMIENCHIEDPQIVDKEDAISCHDNSNGDDIKGFVIIRNNTIIKSGEDGVDLTSGSYLLCKGNTMIDCYEAGVMTSYPQSAHHIDIRNNFVYNCAHKSGYGAMAIRTPHTRLTNNIIAGSGHHMIHMNQNSSDIEVWNNVVCPDGSFTGNVVNFSSNTGGNITFYNNIFDFTRTTREIKGSGLNSQDISFDYNCYFTSSASQEVMDNEVFGDINNQFGFESNGIQVDPKFNNMARVNPNDFKLDPTSPLIDQGLNLNVNEDFDGSPRPFGGNIDIGAFEFNTISTHVAENENLKTLNDLVNIYNMSGQQVYTGPLRNFNNQIPALYVIKNISTTSQKIMFLNN